MNGKVAPASADRADGLAKKRQTILLTAPRMSCKGKLHLKPET
jgi:hypothetical protein